MNFHRNGTYNNNQHTQGTPQQQQGSLNFNSSAQQSHLLQQTQTQLTAQQQQTQNQGLKQRQQLQQLNAAQQSNITVNRDAQLARSKLSSYKSFNLEDDLEFCPSNEPFLASPNSSYSSILPNPFQPRSTNRFLTGNMLKSSSPFNTPTKLNGQSSQQQGNKHTTGLLRVATPNNYMSPSQHHSALHTPQGGQNFHFQDQQQQQGTGNSFGSPQIQGLLRKMDGSPIYTGGHQQQHQQQQQQHHQHHHSQQQQRNHRNW
ncbi:hypothetical protein WICPIJ_000156 [Wickerhamomyces pijperi]|uniref:Uncharacterized protein n=1 Tax=Wickerhamomyces pijperi TaxID=599730 RepID=A0A9P8TSA6_WICPI|nr:hypothetical protein WICPIJ_000156 [Wickerhamomyces pijperi]